MNNIDKVILMMANERKEEKPSQIETQRTFYEYAAKIVPTLESIKITPPGITLYSEETTEVTNNILGSMFFSINQFLESTNLTNVINGWKFLDNDTLLNGLKAFNFYSFFSTNCPKIDEIVAKLYEHLRTQIPKEEISRRVSILVSDCIENVKAQENLFVIYSNLLGENVPMIDGNGFAWVFTSEKNASDVLEQNKGVPLGFKSLTSQEFNDYIKRWPSYGISAFKTNVGCGEHEAEIKVSEYLGEPVKEFDSSILNLFMLRFKQSYGIEELKNIHIISYHFFKQKLRNTLFLIPISYDDDTPDNAVEDFCVHTSQRTAQILLKWQLEKQLGTSLENYVVEAPVTEGKQHPLVGQTFDGYNSNEVPFYGAEEYSFAQAVSGETIQLGKTMHMTTVQNNGHTFLPLFTDMVALHNIFGKNVRVGMFTWEDALDRLKDTVINNDGSVASIEGIAINPGNTNMVLSIEDIKSIEEEGKQQVVKNQLQTQQEQIKETFADSVSKKRSNSFCKASFVLGIISLLLDFTPLTGMLSIIFGLIGRTKADNNTEKGKATAGLIMGIISAVIKTITLIFMIMK